MSETNSNNVINILAQRSSAKAVNPSSLKPYEALTLERNGRRSFGLRINYTNGEIVGVDYAFFKYYHCPSPSTLVLMFTIGASLIKGDNLDKLLDEILAHRVISIQEFKPSVHTPPKDSEARIDSIVWVSSAEIETQIQNEAANS